LLQAVAIQQTPFSLSATGGPTRNGSRRKTKTGRNEKLQPVGFSFF
jgi:hypothetical protein